MLKPEFTKQFLKDFSLAKKRGLNPDLLSAVVLMLAEEKPLPQKYRDHPLENSRKYKGVRECHITPDWILVYKIIRDELILKLIRTGTHSDLF